MERKNRWDFFDALRRGQACYGQDMLHFITDVRPDLGERQIV